MSRERLCALLRDEQRVWNWLYDRRAAAQARSERANAALPDCSDDCPNANARATPLWRVVLRRHEAPNTTCDALDVDLRHRAWSELYTSWWNATVRARRLLGEAR